MIDIARIDAHHDIRVTLSFLFFCVQWFEASGGCCFFDVGRIDDHHFLYFLL